MLSRRSLTSFAGVGAASLLTLAAFTAHAHADDAVSSADFAGQTVVLDWIDHGCPYVQRRNAGTMQALEADAAEDGVV